MNHSFLKKILLGSLFFLTTANATFLQAQEAQPDLVNASVLCGKRPVTIPLFNGPGNDANEGDGTCISDLTETNTTWFTWTGETNGNLSFTIEPLNPNDRIAFVLFNLPDSGGGEPVALRCGEACFAGPTGLVEGDGDARIDCQDSPADAFARALSMQEGEVYGLMIENTTSNEGFTITFEGSGEIVGPVGQILPSATDACFGQSLTFDNDIIFSTGSIIRYDWLVEDGDRNETRTTQQDMDQTFDFTTTGMKRIELTVTTNVGCDAIFETFITINDCCESDNRLAINENPMITQIACPDDTNGAIDIEVTSASNFPVMYNWSNGATTEDISDLAPDTYMVTISNAAGCRDSLTHTFVIPNALTAVETVSPPSCGGLADGSITINASGGRMPYTYDFGDGNGFVANSMLDGLPIGDYTVIVQDDSGCTTTIEAIELDERALNITVSDITNPTCGDVEDGSVEITADNAVGVLTFDFNDGNGPLDPTSLTRLDGGNFIIDVFDSEGCTGNPVEFTLTKPEQINGILEARRSSCNGADDGTAIITATGGVPDYTYLWSTGATTRSINNLAPGTYAVTVTDANGCTFEATSTPIEEPPVLTAAIASVQDVSCPSESNGVIELMVEGGTMPYSYSLDGLDFESGTTISNLDIGDYDITVRDNNGCLVMLNATISSPATISFDVSSTMDICYGESLTFTNTSTFTQGNITTIAWDFGGETMMGETVMASFTTIGRPVVELTITTDLGCTEVLTRELDISVEPCCDQDNGVSFFSLFEEPLCNGAADGSITLNTSSVPPITSIDWNNGATTEIIENLPAGAYTVVVTNDATCEGTTTITLEEPSLITPTFDLTNPTCGVAMNGAISVTAEGGTLDPGNAYEFDFGNGFSTNNTLDNLVFGNFPVMVRDDNNCVVTVDTDLVVPDTSPINATLNLIPATCEAALNGVITVQAIGNSVGTNLLYDFGNGFSTENMAENLRFGAYTIRIQDADNCVLTIDTSLAVSEVPPINATVDVFPVSCAVAANGSISVDARGINNSDLVYDFGDGFEPESIAENLPAGNYTIQIRDADNCVLSLDTSIVVSDIPPINASLELIRPSCEEATNGRIIVNGTSTSTNNELVYDFGNGFSTQNTSNNLPVGNYPIMIQDRDNCTLNLDTMLTVDPNFVPVTATFANITQPSCGGGTDGSITVIPGGEAGSDLTNYTFDFGNGELNVNTSSNLAAGPQLVVIRNINNCSITLDTVLSEPILEPTFIVTRPTCFGLSDGSIIIDVPTPGEGPFLYDFGDGNDFQSEEALTNLPEGTYSVQVQDANLCLSGQLEILVDQPDELALMTTPTDISCFGENDGQIVAEVTGGVGNYTYDWSNGETTNIISNLVEGEYFLAVLDGNNCPVNSDLILITEPAELSVAVGQVDDVLCFGEMNGAITINATGGSAPFEYSLDGIIFQPTATLGGLVAGDYSVIVRDSRACEVPTENITVAEPAEFIITANVNDPITSLGFPINLSAEANTVGGNINYIWTIPDSIVCNNCANFTTVPPGSTTYTVTGVNSDNCQATASVSVQVSTDRPVFIPNIFSPNGDGINDEFFIPFSPAMREIKELRIFDRSGSLVFEAFNIREGEEFLKAWDGTFNGTNLRQGVFVISARILFVDDLEFNFGTDITLITSE